MSDNISPKVVKEEHSLPVLTENLYARIPQYLIFSLTLTTMAVLLLIGIDKFYYYSASESARERFEKQSGAKDIITLIFSAQTTLVCFTLGFYLSRSESKVADNKDSNDNNIQLSESNSSNITFTSNLLKSMDEAESEYQQLLSEERYAEAAELAGNIYKMYEKNTEALKSQRDTDEYISAVSWSSYWKLRQDIYESRSNLIND